MKLYIFLIILILFADWTRIAANPVKDEQDRKVISELWASHELIRFTIGAANAFNRKIGREAMTPEQVATAAIQLSVLQMGVSMSHEKNELVHDETDEYDELIKFMVDKWPKSSDSLEILDWWARNLSQLQEYMLKAGESYGASREAMNNYAEEMHKKAYKEAYEKCQNSDSLEAPSACLHTMEYFFYNLEDETLRKYTHSIVSENASYPLSSLSIINKLNHEFLSGKNNLVTYIAIKEKSFIDTEKMQAAVDKVYSEAKKVKDNKKILALDFLYYGKKDPENEKFMLNELTKGNNDQFYCLMLNNIYGYFSVKDYPDETIRIMKRNKQKTLPVNCVDFSYAVMDLTEYYRQLALEEIK